MFLSVSYFYLASTIKKANKGLERWLSDEQHWLLFQRSWVQFPATTLQLTSVCGSDSRGSGTFRQTYKTHKIKVNSS